MTSKKKPTRRESEAREDYISEKRNHKIKSKTWIVYVNDKITKEPELKKLMCEHMETLLGVTDHEVKKLEEHIKRVSRNTKLAAC